MVPLSCLFELNGVVIGRICSPLMNISFANNLLYKHRVAISIRIIHYETLLLHHEYSFWGLVVLCIMIYYLPLLMLRWRILTILYQFGRSLRFYCSLEPQKSCASCTALDWFTISYWFKTAGHRAQLRIENSIFLTQIFGFLLIIFTKMTSFSPQELQLCCHIGLSVLSDSFGLH